MLQSYRELHQKDILYKKFFLESATCLTKLYKIAENWLPAAKLCEGVFLMSKKDNFKTALYSLVDSYHMFGLEERGSKQGLPSSSYNVL